MAASKKTPKPSASKTQIAKISALLDESDTQHAKSLETYVEASELVFTGFNKKYFKTVVEYTTQLATESEILGRTRSHFTFMNMYKVGLSLKEGRVTREILLASKSRLDMMRRIPAKRPWSHHCYVKYTTCRVSLSVHEQLCRIAERRAQTISEVIEGLLAQAPAVAKKSVKKAA